MKSIIIILFAAVNAFAVPVLNRNLAAEGTVVTIWPDHADPNHFYFAPNFMRIARDAKDAPKFHVTEYALGNCGRLGRRLGKCQDKALITSLLIADFNREQLKEAQAGIKKIRPEARFSAIPYLSSKVEFDFTLEEFIDSHECSPLAGQAADEVPCVITLNWQGMKNLLPYLNSGAVLPFKFVYKIAGLIEVQNGQFEEKLLDYGLTVNLGGEILKGHPDLAGY